jgi:hypothetical protein
MPEYQKLIQQVKETIQRMQSLLKLSEEDKRKLAALEVK